MHYGLCVLRVLLMCLQQARGARWRGLLSRVRQSACMCTCATPPLRVRMLASWPVSRHLLGYLDASYGTWAYVIAGSNHSQPPSRPRHPRHVCNTLGLAPTLPPHLPSAKQAHAHAQSCSMVPPDSNMPLCKLYKSPLQSNVAAPPHSCPAGAKACAARRAANSARPFYPGHAGSPHAPPRSGACRHAGLCAWAACSTARPGQPPPSHEPAARVRLFRLLVKHLAG